MFSIIYFSYLIEKIPIIHNFAKTPIFHKFIARQWNVSLSNIRHHFVGKSMGYNILMEQIFVVPIDFSLYAKKRYHTFFQNRRRYITVRSCLLIDMDTQFTHELKTCFNSKIQQYSMIIHRLKLYSLIIYL
jgi:hypothetical protein